MSKDMEQDLQHKVFIMIFDHTCQFCRCNRQVSPIDFSVNLHSTTWQNLKIYMYKSASQLEGWLEYCQRDQTVIYKLLLNISHNSAYYKILNSTLKWYYYNTIGKILNYLVC